MVSATKYVFIAAPTCLYTSKGIVASDMKRQGMIKMPTLSVPLASTVGSVPYDWDLHGETISAAQARNRSMVTYNSNEKPKINYVFRPSFALEDPKHRRTS